MPTTHGLPYPPSGAVIDGAEVMWLDKEIGGEWFTYQFTVAEVFTSLGGTVSSVGLSLPAIFSVSGSPVTSSGTLSATLATQNANRVWAGPVNGLAATPSFRALVWGDLPLVDALSGVSGLTGGELFAVEQGGVMVQITLAQILAAAASGTVSSVGLSLPAIFSVSGSPVTSSGTLSATLVTQSANNVWAGPSSGLAATPSFRALVWGDLPLIDALSGVSGLVGNELIAAEQGGVMVQISVSQILAAAGSGTVTSVGLSLPAIFSVSGSPVTGAGTLSATLAAQSANQIWAGPSSGSAAAPTFRAAVWNDLPLVDALSGTSGLTGADVVAVEQGGVMVQATVAQVAEYASNHLNATAVTPGAYTNANVTIGADGRVTAAANGASGFTGGTLTSALNEAPTVSIASSSTPAIGAAAGNTILMTGTTTITAFDTIAAGAMRRVRFAGALTLTYNATSLILPTSASITTAADDVAEFLSLGSGNWFCTSYTRKSGASLVSASFTGGTLTSALNEAPTVTIASASTVNIGAAAGNTILVSGTTTITAFDTIAAGTMRRVRFGGILTLTYNATSLILPTSASITTAADDVAEFLSLGSGNWFCTSYSRKSGASLAGAGLVNITETLVSSSPNATVNTEQLAVTGGTTNTDLTLQPKGTGAFILGPAADSASTGGNKRGAQAVDLQISRASAGQVSSGANSAIAGGTNNTNAGPTSSIGGGTGNTVTAGSSGVIAGGSSNTITTGNNNAIGGGTGHTIVSGATNTIVGGNTNSANAGSNGVVIGGSTNATSAANAIAFGSGNNVSGAGAVALGISCTADAVDAHVRGLSAHSKGVIGADVFGSAIRSATGDLQRVQYVLGGSTTDAVTGVVLTTNRSGASASNCPFVFANSVLKIRGQIAMISRGTTTCTTWDISAAFSNNGSTTVAVGTPTITQAQNTGSAPTAPTLVISGSSIQVTVTGLAATTLVWCAELTCVVAG